MSGLLALLDDVAAIAKVAATTVDDVAMAATQAGSKAAGVVIDDAAVTPAYVHGFEPARELPIVWKIALGSVFNKLVILLPAALGLSHLAPWAVTPLLMLGGSYLCFEGAEKVAHKLLPHGEDHHDDAHPTGDPAHLEEEKVRGAVKTDFILSAEIMTIALAAIPKSTLWLEAAALALVGVGITVLVYGSVALIVKMDDVGLYLARTSRIAWVKALGTGLVKAMPRLLAVLSVVGTAAMLWVGGSILIHGLHELGLHHPYAEIHHAAEVVAHAGPAALAGLVAWAVTALCDGVLGLGLGTLLVAALKAFSTRH